MRHAVLIVLAAISCSAPSLSLPDEPGTGRLVGRAFLVNSTHHEQIVVTAVGPRSATAHAFPDGSYVLSGLSAGPCTVMAFAPSTLEGTVQVTVEVPDGGVAAVPDLSLTATGAVQGIARLGKGGLASGGITLASSAARGTVVTDPSGRYALEVAAGSHQLIATRPGFAATTFSIEVAPGERTVAPDVVLPELADSGRITLIGKAKRVSGAAAGIHVEVEGLGLGALTDEQGAFRIEGVPQGYLALTYSAADHQPTTLRNVLALGYGSVALEEITLYPGERRHPTAPASSWPSPDGRYLVFSAAEKSGSALLALYLLDLELPGPAVQLDTTVPQTVTFSREGRFAAYSGHYGIMVLDLKQRTLRRASVGWSDAVVAFPAEGKTLVFMSGQDLTELDLETLQTVVVGKVEAATRTPSCYPPSVGASWALSADGSLLAWIEPIQGRSQVRLRRAGVTTTLDSPSVSAWLLLISPDSQLILWSGVGTSGKGTEVETWSASAWGGFVPRRVTLGACTGDFRSTPDLRFVFTRDANTGAGTAIPTLGPISSPQRVDFWGTVFPPATAQVSVQGGTDLVELSSGRRIPVPSQSQALTASPDRRRFSYQVASFTVNVVDLGGGAELSFAGVTTSMFLADGSGMVMTLASGEVAWTNYKASVWPPCKVGPGTLLQLSRTGRRVATKDRGTLHVVDLGTGASSAVFVPGLISDTVGALTFDEVGEGVTLRLSSGALWRISAGVATILDDGATSVLRGQGPVLAFAASHDRLSAGLYTVRVP